MSMKQMKLMLGAVLVVSLACSCKQQTVATAPPPGLKDVVEGKFTMGVAVTPREVTDTNAVKLIKQHFNSIVAENVMKSMIIHPAEDHYNFASADTIVNFAHENGMEMIGHCLIWHSQLAKWFCVDKDGKLVTPEVLKQRMKDHITTILTHYKGKIKGYDVVNEAILEDGSYRKSPFYEILGEEFIPLAFQYAHEADPDVELYYNDYGMNVPGRRDGVVKLIRQLKERGLRIDAVGMQGHMGMDHPDIEEFERSIEAFAAEGVKVMITEWDMSALPTVSRSANVSDTVAFKQRLNPYPEALPDSVSEKWNARMKTFFELFEKHSDVIQRVTAWGLTDRGSWKNNFPVPGRKDYPLLIDRDGQPKPFVLELIDEAQKNQNNTH